MSKLPGHGQTHHGKLHHELLHDNLLHDVSLPSSRPGLQPLPHHVAELPSVGERPVLWPYLSFLETPVIVLQLEA